MDVINFPPVDFKTIFWIYVTVVGIFGVAGLALLCRGLVWRDLTITIGGIWLLGFSLFMLFGA